MRILIADDEMISRATIQRMIRNYCPWAGQVKEASDGREAVEKAMELDADVVLMDIEMPELDGMEAARRLQAVEGRMRHHFPDCICYIPVWPNRPSPWEPRNSW